MTPRETLLARLRGQRFDLLVIGGGIVGAGIARDAAMRGLCVALIEQGDFASGTSSKTSKLIHGGLRYLEHGHLKLVFESLRERQILRTIAPALVHPRMFLLPAYEGDRLPAWKLNVGLWFYDLLALGRNIRPHRMLSAQRAMALEPGLCVDGLRAAGLYADCQMDDARLCLANVLQAADFGAVCANYVRLRAFLRADARLCGGLAEDAFTGRTFEIHAEVVVNATGPWGDATRRLSEGRLRPRLAPNKGIHLIVPRVAHEPLFVQSPRDQRLVFILPWGEDATLIGTTERPVDSALETLAATADEVGYLLDVVQRVLPGARLRESDILATFAGARPLLAHEGSATRASREHVIEVDGHGLVSALGGKFTTYRLMATQAVDVIARERRWRTERDLTHEVSLLEAAQPIVLDHWRDLLRRVDPDTFARWLTRYGAATFELLRLVGREPSLLHPLCPHYEVTAAELVHALRHEFACTITDLLARRTHLAWSSCQGLDALSTVTDLMRRYGGCAPLDVERQVEAYHQFLASGLAFRLDRQRPPQSSGARPSRRQRAPVTRHA